jgi:endonuclease/exonuclease/phosphatase family metal-dependent hydrolase
MNGRLVLCMTLAFGSSSPLWVMQANTDPPSVSVRRPLGRPPSKTPRSIPPVVRGEGRPTSMTFGIPELFRPRSSSGQDLSDHAGLIAQVTVAYQPGGRLTDGQPKPPEVVRFKLLTYNIAQVPEVPVGQDLLGTWLGLVGVERPSYRGSRSALENLEDIIRHVREGDFGVVCLQEAFWSGQTFPGGHDIRELLGRGLRDVLPYQASGPGAGPGWDSGLMILSKFPFERHEVHTHEYEEGVGIPDNFVNKGILHARVLIDREQRLGLDIFTTHTQSASDDDQKANRGAQFGEARDFIDRRRRSASAPLEWILAGDLNVAGKLQEPNYDFVGLPQRERRYTTRQDEYSRMMNTLGRPRDIWTEFFDITCSLGDRCNPGFTTGNGNNFEGQPKSGGNRLDYILVEQLGGSDE